MQVPLNNRYGVRVVIVVSSFFDFGCIAVSVAALAGRSANAKTEIADATNRRRVMSFASDMAFLLLTESAFIPLTRWGELRWCRGALPGNELPRRWRRPDREPR